MTRIFVTGGTGCIGATTVHHLLQHPVDEVIIGSRSSDPRRLQLWLGQNLDARIRFVTADIGNASEMRRLLLEHKPTHLVHLGALQSPDCDADPARGMEVNVGGTLRLFQAIHELDIPLQRFVFASSAAVYGQRSMYPPGNVVETARLAPPNLYGVWKVAGEHLAALFHRQTGIPTVCLRLNTTYGPGRDLGKTSAPTAALKAIAQGAQEKQSIPFAMPYQGRENYHYVEDVGAHFAGVALQPFEGFAALNIKGKTIPVSEFLQIARSVADDLDMGEYCDLSVQPHAEPNLFICDLDDSAIDESFPDLPRTDVASGVRKSLQKFRTLAEENR